ncbi:MAG: hypothetical protein DWQ34_26265 [Planctomycetota bacterium]|nr:MAG: hypothetical protein DWQ34_26265 [Planctomycetota bacterium]REJ91250.1 MAG: hypothetical protein DWQ29_05875 [Planctomycetota bacterium]REK22729.1 MAG: hypothetical protein DWQ41_18170 [Planctomycetota bacterium]REK33851.1 MAG: hypothetical protein DWQ45_14820 [Planctomycetota bacterium]
MTLIVWCALIVLASLAGGVVSDRVQLTHRSMQFIMSSVGGLMLGIALLHMVPHAAAELGSIDEACRAAVAGLLIMFLLLRIFHFHEHEPLDAVHDHAAASGQCSEHAPQSACHGPHVHGADSDRRLSWGGVAFGLALHTLLDGMALAAAVEAETGMLAGLGVFLAILLHKPLDAVSITTLMRSGGWSRAARVLVNAAFALMCPAGALLFVSGVEQFSGMQGAIVGAALGFSAGVFLCISMSDLLPEIEFHAHDRFWLTVCLVAGVVAAALIGFVDAV